MYLDTVPGVSGYKCGKPSILIFPKTSKPGRKGYSPSLLYNVLQTKKIINSQSNIVGLYFHRYQIFLISMSNLNGSLSSLYDFQLIFLHENRTKIVQWFSYIAFRKLYIIMHWCIFIYIYIYLLSSGLVINTKSFPPGNRSLKKINKWKYWSKDIMLQSPSWKSSLNLLFYKSYMYD